MKGYYEIDRAGTGFHFTLHAGNHEVILSSQTYADKSGAEGGIAAVRENGSHDARFQRMLSAIGEPYFTLKSGNGEIIGTGEMYGSEASRDDGIQAVMSCCGSSIVKDLTV